MNSKTEKTGPPKSHKTSWESEKAFRKAINKLLTQGPEKFADALLSTLDESSGYSPALRIKAAHLFWKILEFVREKGLDQGKPEEAQLKELKEFLQSLKTT